MLDLLDRFGNNTVPLEAALVRSLQAEAPSSFPCLKLTVEHNVGAAEQNMNLKDKIEQNQRVTICVAPIKVANGTAQPQWFWASSGQVRKCRQVSLAALRRASVRSRPAPPPSQWCASP